MHGNLCTTSTHNETVQLKWVTVDQQLRTSATGSTGRHQRLFEARPMNTRQHLLYRISTQEHRYTVAQKMFRRSFSTCKRETLRGHRGHRVLCKAVYTGVRRRCVTLAQSVCMCVCARGCTPKSAPVNCTRIYTDAQQHDGYHYSPIKRATFMPQPNSSSE
jgi:hypothetical protein